MSRRLTRTAQAEQDLIDIATYIAKDDVEAATRLLVNLDAKSTLLTAFPRLGRADPERPGRRIHTVGRYLIIYKETPEEITVLRYLHGRRDRRWIETPA